MSAITLIVNGMVFKKLIKTLLWNWGTSVYFSWKKKTQSISQWNDFNRGHRILSHSRLLVEKIRRVERKTRCFVASFQIVFVKLLCPWLQQYLCHWVKNYFCHLLVTPLKPRKANQWKILALLQHDWPDREQPQIRLFRAHAVICSKLKTHKWAPCEVVAL